MSEATYDETTGRWSEPVPHEMRFYVLDKRHPEERVRPMRRTITEVSVLAAIEWLEGELVEVVGKRRPLWILPIDCGPAVPVS